MTIRTRLGRLVMACLVLTGVLGECIIMSEPTNQPAAAGNGKQLLTLGGGCFWCVEAVFDDLKGVERVESGYSGGSVKNPTYEQICTGRTGHAEVVQVTFDPKVLALRDLVDIFFYVHDPTTLNHQGADVGPQYRSVIFYRNPEQKATAEQVIRDVQAAKLWNAPIVTELSPFKEFYKAENYHQEYYKRNGTQPYCRVVIAPKMAKFRERYRDKLKSR